MIRLLFVQKKNLRAKSSVDVIYRGSRGDVGYYRFNDKCRGARAHVLY